MTERPQRGDRTRAPSVASARAVALRCLLRIDHEGAYANLVVASELGRSRLSDRDRRFVTELVYGTTRMRRACDALVERFMTHAPVPHVGTLLRLGAYQLHFAGVAAHAAVAETVELAPRSSRALVNAVLRKVASTPMSEWPSVAVRLSYPDWIVQRLTAELGEGDALATLTMMNEPAAATERDDGYFQDLASQWVAAAVPAQFGELVLDVCAAPGGKATAIAAAGATVVATDLHPHRVALIESNAARLGATGVLAVVADATASPLRSGCADHVLIDAPCSGLGALRRRADARWRIEASDVPLLAALQRQIIDDAATLVRPGGTLTYSVCTLLAAESVDHPVPGDCEVIAEPPAEGSWQPYRHGWRVLPHEAGTDGMIMLRYCRRA